MRLRVDKDYKEKFGEYWEAIKVITDNIADYYINEIDKTVIDYDLLENDNGIELPGVYRIEDDDELDDYLAKVRELFDENLEWIGNKVLELDGNRFGFKVKDAKKINDLHYIWHLTD